MVRTGRSRQGFYRNRVFSSGSDPGPATGFLRWGAGSEASWWPRASRAGRSRASMFRPRRSRCRHPSTGSRFRHGTLETLDAAPGRYRAIVCWEVLEHLAHPRDFLLRARELLQSDGLLACSVPNNGSRVPAVPTRFGGRRHCRPFI